jgi:hypothetical protein
MTIRVKKDRIEFVSDEGTTYTLRETGDGFSFNGVIEGTNIFSSGFQGTRFGYTLGGAGGPGVNTIDKFPFAVDTNATDVGDLVDNGLSNGGQQSLTHAYASSTAINKVQFATDTNGTSVGSLTQSRSGSGHSSQVSGYTTGGYPPQLNTIDKFSFATDGNATDVGDLAVARRSPAGQSSSVSGYSSGGGFPEVNTIEKFPFATDTNATDIGDLTIVRRAPGGVSSASSGYTIGGLTPGGSSNVIDKFPFATDTNATDVGDLLLTGGSYQNAVSAVNFGYSTGSYASAPGTSPFAATNTIQKFPFATDTNATDVGDTTQARRSAAGSQT